MNMVKPLDTFVTKNQTYRGGPVLVVWRARAERATCAEPFCNCVAIDSMLIIEVLPACSFTLCPLSLRPMLCCQA